MLAWSRTLKIDIVKQSRCSRCGIVKRMAKAYFGAFVLAILASSAIFPSLVRSVNYVPGVKVGDWIKYGEYKVTWNGTGAEPSYIADEKKVEWLRIDFENVSGTMVTLNGTVQLNNGTQTSQNFSIDVTGNPNMSGVNLLIACNLERGDHLTNQGSSPTINQTTTGIYAGANRNINLAEMSSVRGNQTTTAKICWDQSTGAMVETHSNSPDYYNATAAALGAYIELSIKATETNMWSPDLLGSLSNNLIYIVAGTIVIIAVIVTAIFLRRKKQSTPPSPSPTEATQTSAANLHGDAYSFCLFC